jgi:hypothetical protein
MVPPTLYQWTGLPWLAMVWTRIRPKEIWNAMPASMDAEWEKNGAETTEVQSTLIKALALSAPGSVGWGGGTARVTDWPRASPTTIFVPGVLPSIVTNAFRAMNLTASDFETLKGGFRALLQRRAIKDGASIGARRLAAAMENERDDDRFVDLMIAAEALFGDSREKTDIKYKFALRAAYLLAPDTPVLRREIFDEMRVAYDLRSAIVHGNEPKASITVHGMQLSLCGFVDRIADRVREAERLALASPSKFNPSWDDQIVGPPS